MTSVVRVSLVSTLMRRVLALGLAACLGAPLPVAAQTQDSKPATASEKPRDQKEKPAPPPARRRESQKRDPGEERPRLDVPVSFPVDI
ncbi:MAG: hypothetical protein OEN48_08690 [Betaproteobacteria bacterium]|nr:hypothetical protein [Betaproteobacteria bacterium]